MLLRMKKNFEYVVVDKEASFEAENSSVAPEKSEKIYLREK